MHRDRPDWRVRIFRHHFYKEKQMQPMGTPPKAGSIAFQRGLIFGIIQAVVAACISLINNLVLTAGNAGLGFGLAALNFIVSLALFFVAGMLAAKQTGKVSTGTLAGMWTGIVYGVINLVLSLVIFFAISLPKALTILNSSGTLSSGNADTVRTAAMVGGIVALVFGSLFAVGFGAGMGALGGLLGKSQSNVPTTPVAQSYPVYNQPYPGQPVPPTPYTPAPGQPTNPYGQPTNPYAQPTNPYQQNPDQPGSNPYTEQPH
jgi:hypothetical protein